MLKGRRVFMRPWTHFVYSSELWGRSRTDGGQAENQSSSHSPLTVDQLKISSRFDVLMEVGPELELKLFKGCLGLQQVLGRNP